MDIAVGEWDIVRGFTDLLGVAYSLCYDRAYQMPSSMFFLKKRGTPRRRLSLAGVWILGIRRIGPIVISFEGVVGRWNGRSCETRLVSGTINVRTFSGTCSIGEVASIVSDDDLVARTI